MAWKAVNSGRRERYLGEEFCKPNCKPTARHRAVLGITNQDRQRENGEQERMVRYKATRSSMRILELENRCTGNRTVGSNPTLSANFFANQRVRGSDVFQTYCLNPRARRHPAKKVEIQFDG